MPYSAGGMLASKVAYAARNSFRRVYPSLVCERDLGPCMGMRLPARLPTVLKADYLILLYGIVQKITNNLQLGKSE